MADTKIELTREQIDALADAIKNQPRMGGAEDFCNNWDKARGILQLLAPILSAVPGVGVFAGPAIGVVVAAGDATKKAICH